MLQIHSIVTSMQDRRSVHIQSLINDVQLQILNPFKTSTSQLVLSISIISTQDNPQSTSKTTTRNCNQRTKTSVYTLFSSCLLQSSEIIHVCFRNSHKELHTRINMEDMKTHQEHRHCTAVLPVQPGKNGRYQITTWIWASYYYPPIFSNEPKAKINISKSYSPG